MLFRFAQDNSNPRGSVYVDKEVVKLVCLDEDVDASEHIGSIEINLSDPDLLPLTPTWSVYAPRASLVQPRTGNALNFRLID
jgi:hypothetical protein